jgi:hypothetical protein
MTNLLILRLAIVNFFFGACLFAAWQLGYVGAAFKSDTSGISHVIVALFTVGLALSTWRGMKTSAALNDVKDGIQLSQRTSKMPAKNAHLSEIAKWLAALGMFGTVVGLIQMAFALRGMDLTSADNLGAVLATAFEGYGVALVTTAVGLVAGTWIEVNALMINTATACLIEDAKDADFVSYAAVRR